MCALAVLNCSGSPPEAPPFSHLQVAAGARAYHVPSSVDLPLSVVELEDGRWALCDGKQIFVLARQGRGYAISQLAPPKVKIWSPAGLASRNGLLLVANSSGHDLLELELAGDQLSFFKRIADPQMVTPVNLAIDSDGSVVAADPDGGGVLYFNPEGALKWRYPLDQAHGVTVSGGLVYATSLSGRTITRIDPGEASGDPSRRYRGSAGSLGGSKGRYQWPVGLASAGNEIVVTDALSGRISFLDQDLHEVRHAGANGPGLDAFDFPSATLPVSGGYLVVDTYKNRLIRLNSDLVIQDQIALGQVVPVGRQRPLISVSDARPYPYGHRSLLSMDDSRRRRPLPGADIAAAMGLRSALSFTGAFGGLDHFGTGGDYAHLDLSSSELQFSGITWAEQIGSLILAGSPQTAALEVIDPQSGTFVALPVDRDSWWWAGRLLTPDNVSHDFGPIIQQAQDRFQSVRSSLDARIPRVQAFNTYLNQGREKNWSLDLTSEPAQRFWASGRTQADAQRYFDWASRQSQLRVVELLEVRYLSGS